MNTQTATTARYYISCVDRAEAWGYMQARRIQAGFAVDVIETTDVLEDGERIWLHGRKRIGAMLANNVSFEDEDDSDADDDDFDACLGGGYDESRSRMGGYGLD